MQEALAPGAYTLVLGQASTSSRGPASCMSEACRQALYFSIAFIGLHAPAPVLRCCTSEVKSRLQELPVGASHAGLE